MIPSYQLLIREFHLDTFGHVNNATYLQIYEEARWELISGRGYDLNKIKITGLGPVILDVHLKFIKEIGLREMITVTTELVDYAGKVGHLKQQMIKADGSIASEAIFKFALFDTKLRKIVAPTSDWQMALGMGPA